ncbi:hypothetical protein PAPH110629_04610 [Paenibacillus phoenicis]
MCCSLLTVFAIFFAGPLLNLLVLAFSEKWNYPDVLPATWGFKWWNFVLAKDDIVSSISLSFLIAAIVTALSILICIPTAYAFARIQFPLKRMFLFSFLLTHGCNPGIRGSFFKIILSIDLVVWIRLQYNYAVIFQIERGCP